MDKITKKRKRIETFAIVNSNAAGIDIGDTEIAVAVSPDKADENVRTYRTFTCDLKEIIKWMQECGITSAAMESTGVYWVSLFLMLQEAGIEVYLVNAKHVKNVTGRKEDEGDAVWIQKLHSCGLLSNSFQPDRQTRALRDIVRHRKNLVRDNSKYLNRIQKSLELMNIKVHTVISEIDGKTGQSILKAILNGERNPQVLADLADKRIKASREEILMSLEGHWKEEHLFTLKQYYEMYLHILEKIKECDMEIEKLLVDKIANQNQGEIPAIDQKIKRKRSKSRPSFNFTGYLQPLCHVNLTEVVGISEISALEIISEVGVDMTKWPSHKHFASWLGLSPNTKKSGGKIISSRIMKKKNNASIAFRIAANSLYNSKTPLGDYFRRIKSHAGAPKAIVATAHKLSIIYYHIMLNKEQYNPKALEEAQIKYRHHKIKKLEQQLAKLKAA